MNEHSIYETLERLRDEPVEVNVEGFDDRLRVHLELSHFPPAELVLRPTDLYVDGTWVEHCTARPEPELGIGEDERFRVGKATVRAWDRVEGGPGPAELRLWLETE